MLNTECDADGLEFLTNALASGWSRAGAILAFADCDEIVSKSETDIFDYMRSTLAAEMSDTLIGGAGDDAMIGGIGADTFHFVAGETGTDLIGDLEAWDWVSFEGFGYTDAADVTGHMTENSEGVIFSDQG